MRPPATAWAVVGVPSGPTWHAASCPLATPAPTQQRHPGDTPAPLAASYFPLISQARVRDPASAFANATIHKQRTEGLGGGVGSGRGPPKPWNPVHPAPHTSFSMVDAFGLLRDVFQPSDMGPAASSSRRARPSTSRASRTCARGGCAACCGRAAHAGAASRAASARPPCCQARCDSTRPAAQRTAALLPAPAATRHTTHAHTRLLRGRGPGWQRPLG
jgi:hypothetical protein